MPQAIADENLEYNIRKEQAIELGITITECMTLECIEKAILSKLELGMQDIKSIVNEIDNTDFNI